nr:energy transducer TonB [uncultured Mucilaginibacter sp.]
MKRILTFVIFLSVTLASCTLLAQSGPPTSGNAQLGSPNAVIRLPGEPETSTDPDHVYTSIEVAPSFKDGFSGLITYFNKNMKYPQLAKQNGVEGKVFLVFIVEKDGSLSSPKIIKGIGSGCDEEAMRLISASPKWSPGQIGGKPVRVQYTLPIVFDIANAQQK